MADRKSSKTTKKADEVKSIEQLRQELQHKQNDYIEAKRGHRLGELTNTCVLRKTRKEIARLHTAIRLSERAENKENK